jgi:hypothetical protein
MELLLSVLAAVAVKVTQLRQVVVQVAVETALLAQTLGVLAQ